MIDFVKIGIDQLTAKELLSNKLLDFSLLVSEKTGEIKYREAKYKNLDFTVYENGVGKITGSLHKFWRNNANYDDFYFRELIEVIDTLKNSFGINAHHARLQNVEIGVNLTELPIRPDQFINTLIHHKGEPFSRMRNIHRKSLGKDCYHQRYGIKIYNKAKQYGLPYPVLRYELKYIKMKELNEIGIFTLYDLTKPDILPALGALLEAKFRDILLIEPQIPKKDLKSVERRNLANYTNVHYWEELNFRSPKKYQYHRKRYDEIIGRYVVNPVKGQITNAIRQKWQILTFTNPKTLDKLTDLQKSMSGNINHSYSRLKDYKFTEVNTIKKRVCSYTGKDISNQRADSKFISAKNTSYEYAHKVRNRDSNPRNNLRRRILKGEELPTLFDVNQCLKLSDKDKELLKFWEGTKYEVRIN
ncbi:hypothetical protein WJR50_06595 [Catalinimonas sp. 4WD22]